MTNDKNLSQTVQPAHGLGTAVIICVRGDDDGCRGRYVQPGGGLWFAQQRLRFAVTVLFRRRQTAAAAAEDDVIRRPAAEPDRARVFRFGLHVPVLVLETAPVRRALVLAPGRFRWRDRRRDRRERLQTIHDGAEHGDNRGTSNPGKPRRIQRFDTITNYY